MSYKRGIVVWSRMTRRSHDIALKLSLNIFHFKDRPPYLRAWIKTSELFKKLGKDSCVILQLPPGPAVLRSTMFSTRPKLLCDCHTGMFYYRNWKDYILNRPFRRFLSKCDIILVHNPESKDLLRKLIDTNVRIEVIYDPIPVAKQVIKPNYDFYFNNFILLPVSWEADERIDIVVKAYIKSRMHENNIGLVITGDFRKNLKLYKNLNTLISKSHISNILLKNIVFTGYIPYSQYMWLIKKSMAVIALTNWEYTLLSVIWEAAKYDKPILFPNTHTFSRFMSDIYDQNYTLKYQVDSIKSLSSLFSNLLKNYSKYKELGRIIGKGLRILSEQSMSKLSKIC